MMIFMQWNLQREDSDFGRPYFIRDTVTKSFELSFQLVRCHVNLPIMASRYASLSWFPLLSAIGGFFSANECLWVCSRISK